MDLKDFMLSEISQSQKDNILVFFLYKVSKVKLTETENRMVVAKGCREGEMGKCCSEGIKLQLCKMNNF